MPHPHSRIATTRAADGAGIAYACYADPAPGRCTALLIHGWCCYRGFWSRQLTPLAERMPVAAVDLAGHGASAELGPGRSAGVDIPAMAQDVVAVVQDLALDEVVLVGHSMGGAVAVEAALALDGMVRGVVLVDTFVLDYGGMEAEDMAGLVSAFEEDFAGSVAQLVRQTCLEQTPAALMREVAGEMAATGPEVGVPLMAGMLGWPAEERLGRLEVPLASINADLIDERARARHGHLWHESRIPDSGHFLHMERPEAFNRELLATLDRMGCQGAGCGA